MIHVRLRAYEHVFKWFDQISNHREESKMRDTAYATEIATASVTLGDGTEARLERIYVKADEAEEIRFSWWKMGTLSPDHLIFANPI